MSGTHSGGIKAAQTIKRKLGEDYFKKHGRRIGQIGTTGGYASELVGKDGLTGVQRSKIQGSIAGKRSGHLRRVKREFDMAISRIDIKKRIGAR